MLAFALIFTCLRSCKLLITVDLYNDRDIDITTTYRTQRCVYYSENINTGDTIISKLRIDIKDCNPEHSQIADLNSDNDLDIIIGSWPDEGIFGAENFLYKILNQPFDQFTCEAENAYFSVISTGVEVYQWQINTGSGFENITNNTTYSGANKAQLIITNFSETMVGNEFRSLIYYKKNEEIGTSNVCTVFENEFDISVIFNKCNENFTITNDYNNSETLAGACSK